MLFPPRFPAAMEAEYHEFKTSNLASVQLTGASLPGGGLPAPPALSHARSCAQGPS